ncbi:MAG: hypothetical protein ACE5DX_02885 [Candidatus Dojkabacteria bacterium]
MEDTKFETKLQRYAIYSPKEINESPIDYIFDGLKLEMFGKGMQARTYKIKGKDWVVKEGRWDLDLSVLFGGSNIPFPATITAKVMNLFSFTFLPDKKEIAYQYKMYLTFVKYFGYFRKDGRYFHPQRSLLLGEQKRIRDSLLDLKPKIEKKYKLKFNNKIDKILTSNHKYHNFLPKEYLLFGQSISPENKGKPTYFIVQEFIKGELLHDTENEELSDQVLSQLIILIYLILVMHMKDHLLPDTRPRYPLLEANDWLTKTDNIIVSKKRLTFIDTRWFWDTRGNFIKRGGIIPVQIIRLAKYYLTYLLDDVA